MTKQDYENYITQAVQGTGLSANLIIAQIEQESGFNPNAKSGAGAVGISQFIPSTAQQYGLQVGNGVDDRLDPIKSINAQIKYMQDLVSQYGSTERALSAYNSGNPDAYQDPNFAKGQTYNYVKSIMGNTGQTQVQQPQQQTQPQPKTTGVKGFLNNIFTPGTVQAQGLTGQYSQASGSSPSNQYTVKAGDTMWGIAQKYLGNGANWKQLQGYSGDPTKLPVGTKITY